MADDEGPDGHSDFHRPDSPRSDFLKSDLGVRTVSAVVMVALAGIALWLGGPVWMAFVGAVAIAALWEWRALVRGFVRGPGGQAGWLAAGVLYIGFACAVLLVFRQIDVAHALLPVLVTVATDTGAYFTGRALGGPKIAPAVSPSKTWSGLLGGMTAAGAATGWWADRFADAGEGAVISFAAGFAAGAILAVLAQAGDFLESWMKRRAGVKDSGNLIPGHGGVLDRVDGLLAVTAACGAIWIVMVLRAG
ncbi:MAG: phosphatidate cytidylyltransferase [Novosphingobium sp.]|nr:phosphatidate cytidylyltransferase [Novosphingobium sp.]